MITILTKSKKNQSKGNQINHNKYIPTSREYPFILIISNLKKT